MPRTINLNFDLWPRQLEAFQSFAQEKLYGGAAGGGKSHYERVEAIALCLEIPGLQYFLFRRNFQDLQKSYVEGPSGFKALLGELIHEGVVESVAKEIRFPNGSKIYLCHCQHESDVFGFGSFEFHVLNIAEAGEFTPFMIRYLRSRVRMPEDFQARLPKKFLIPKEFWRRPNKPEYSLPRATYTCNPVGPGKAYLKQAFADVGPGKIWRAADDDGGMLRQYIPAKLRDNPSLDPVQYAAQLKGIGSQAYVEALLEGNWNATIGAFFPQIDRELHLVRPIVLPDRWPRFMGYDHGAAGNGDPFSCGWYTVADGSIPMRSAYTGEIIPCQRESIICYRRWNGGGLPKTNVAEIADGIHRRESEEILFRVAGGDILEQRGHVNLDAPKAKGESIFSLFRSLGLNFIMADRRRQNGWAQIDYRLTGKNDYPLAFWFEDCAEDLDQLGNLQHDPHDPNDIAEAEDDDADRTRYAFMTRPLSVSLPEARRIDMRDKNRRATPSSIVAEIQKKHRGQKSYVKQR